jgi:predicted amidohydrolase
MRVAAFQFDVRRGEVAANLAAVEQGLREARGLGIELVVLPEMWPTSFIDAERVDEAWLAASDAAVDRLSRLSAELGLAVAGSAFGRAGDGAQPRNRLHVIDRGRIVLAYDKVHLFSPTAEAESFSAGDAPPVAVSTSVGVLSGVVCYDLRFAPVVGAAILQGAELLVVPAQWPSPRASHWHALVLGRAVEGQCFVIAANRLGRDLVGRRRLELEFPGNSLVADPHGRALAEGSGGSGLVWAEIDLENARALRASVPVAQDRRADLYRRWS